VLLAFVFQAPLEESALKRDEVQFLYNHWKNTLLILPASEAKKLGEFFAVARIPSPREHVSTNRN
jgi:hypothetical protein